jgi:hypothetical protein
MNPIVVAVQDYKLTAIIGIPNPDGPIAGRGGQPPPIRRPRHPMKPVVVAAQDYELTGSFGVPNPGGPIA